MEASILRLGQSLLFYEKKMSVLSDNVANADTPGFKSDDITALTFDDALSAAIENSQRSVDADTLYFQMQTSTAMSQGNLEPTGDAADLALSGSGFFCVQAEGGQLYTRSVTLSVDGAGYLTDARGNRLLGDGGAILVGNGEVTVDTRGSVRSDGVTVGRLRLADGNFIKTAEGYYAADGTVTEAGCKVLQGYEEQSNVDITQEYLGMMSINRNYETVQRVISILDGVTGKAASQIGQL